MRSEWESIESCPETDTVWLGIQGNPPWIGFKLKDGTWGKIRDFPRLKPPTHWMPITMPDPPLAVVERRAHPWQLSRVMPLRGRGLAD